jgi:glycosyltransferase involved in cell wall biosynthesis
MRLNFITSTPLNIVEGSGTFSGIVTLARALGKLGVSVEIVSPSLRLPVYTASRLLFNERLPFRRMPECDAVIGFDMDGYRLAGRNGPRHIASIKGVIADEMRFERGVTRRTMAIQAACERLHVRRADRVITTSRYAAGRLQALYGIQTAGIVPELIDLAAWRELFARHPAPPNPGRFTVLSVCRFYPRKRLHLLLQAAGRLRLEIPELEIRIVGGGPEAARLRKLCQELRLTNFVRFPGDLSQDELAAEYNRADVFCLPSVQEGFGIVFLEAMAAAKPIVAVNAAAVPEVVKHGILVPADDAASLADGIHRLYRQPEMRAKLGEAGRRDVEQYDAPKVAQAFLGEIGRSG